MYLKLAYTGEIHPTLSISFDNLQDVGQYSDGRPISASPGKDLRGLKDFANETGARDLVGRVLSDAYFTKYDAAV